MRAMVLGVIAAALLVAGSSVLSAQEPGSDRNDAEARARARLQLQAFIASWASAWQSQFDDVYLLHYDSSFQPEGFKSLDEWQAARRNKVTEPQAINLSLDGFELVEFTGDTALVRFWLDYSRPGYADRTHKEMRLRQERELWKIEREHNMEVVRQAPDQDEPALAETPAAKSPTPAGKTAGIAAVKVTTETSDMLLAEVMTWVSAWQSQLADKYLAYYHAAFKPDDGQSLEAWKSQRRSRLKGSQITIAVREFAVLRQEGNTAVVRFWLDYRRDGYADHTLKELALRREGDRWLIEREHNQQVTRQAR